MQPEAGVVGPLLAIAFILGTALFRSLSERSGQVPASTLTNSVANDRGCVKTVLHVVLAQDWFKRNVVGAWKICQGGRFDSFVACWQLLAAFLHSLDP